MDFTIVADAVSEKAIEAVKYILRQNWSPAQKRKYLTRLYRLTGDEFYDKIFSMSSNIFDSTAISSEGFLNPDDQIERLAAKTVQNYNLTREESALVTEYYFVVMDDATKSSFKNAKSLDKHPTLTRTAHAGACKFCQSMVGVYTNPDSEAFRHHENCRCSFRYSGYGLRDGTYRGHAPNRYERPV